MFYIVFYVTFGTFCNDYRGPSRAFWRSSAVKVVVLCRLYCFLILCLSDLSVLTQVMFDVDSHSFAFLSRIRSIALKMLAIMPYLALPRAVFIANYTIIYSSPCDTIY